MPVYKEAFKSFCNILAAASKLILSILEGILFLVDNLLWLMSLIFLQLKATGSNENLFWLPIFLLMRMMALLTGSLTFWKFDLWY